MAKSTSGKRKAPAPTDSKSSSAAVRGTPSLTAGGDDRLLNTRPDGIDFRDLMYVPTLVEVPTEIDLADYQKEGVPILNQGREGACTGFGLATVAHYLLITRKIHSDKGQVSPFMFYDMARRYDEWAGEDYDGSSCRGAMKGWYKHGVCKSSSWTKSGKGIQALTHDIVQDAADRPLGAYFRVNHKDLVAMHAAISEVHVLYASASVHTGWQKVKTDGRIPYETSQLGGHAFAIVAYDREGFWIQNSWGPKWGAGGFGHISYEDWLANATDVWVARLGVPVNLPASVGSASTGVGAVRSAAFNYVELRPHVISLKNDGQLDEHGDIGTSPAMVREILQTDFPRITQGWKKRRLVLYAHGGLVGQDAALQRVADYRESMLEAECYPLAFIWKTDYWSTLKNILMDATARRRPEGIIDAAKDFMLDRLDDALEPLARQLTGKAQWDEMKENALMATTTKSGGARIVADEIAALVKGLPNVELHIVCHSAGSILHAPLVQYLTGANGGQPSTAKGKGLGLPIKTCTLWAPACTVRLFKDYYLPAIGAGQIDRFALFTLTDKAERDDDCANIYHKSLLYLVSNAFEETARIPIVRPDGESILGMDKFVRDDPDLKKLFAGKNAEWVLCPNTEPVGSVKASASAHHGDFDDDEATVRATLARVLGQPGPTTEISFESTAMSRRGIRRRIDGLVDPALTR